MLYEELPRVWSLNYLLAERDLDEATAEALAAEAEELLGGAGLRHRKVEVLDEAAGERLAGEFQALGWHVERDLVQPHRRAVDREADISSSRRSTRTRSLRSGPRRCRWTSEATTT